MRSHQMHRILFTTCILLKLYTRERGLVLWFAECFLKQKAQAPEC